MNSIITEENPYARAYQNDLSIFDHILHDPALMVDPEHIIGKLTKEIHLKDYHITEEKILTDKSLKIWDVQKHKNVTANVYKFSNTQVLDKYLKQVSIDAKISGLLKKADINTLLTYSHIMISENPNKPLIINLGSTCYFIAPVVFDND